MVVRGAGARVPALNDQEKRALAQDVRPEAARSDLGPVRSVEKIDGALVAMHVGVVPRRADALRGVEKVCAIDEMDPRAVTAVMSDATTFLGAMIKSATTARTFLSTSPVASWTDR